MLKNIRLTVQYDGADYYGWQIQTPSHKPQATRRKLKTVQGELEKALRRLFRKRIRAVSSGRTDRGVHARKQCVNFKVATKIPKKNIKQALNTYLPKDIYIREVEFAPLDFHARFRARSKTYRYIILNKKDPDVFLRDYVWHVPDKLCLAKMRDLSQYLIGRKDFSSFAQEASGYKTCVRRIHRIGLKRKDDRIYIDIVADGFLRGMARNIVRFLVDAGRGKIDQKRAKNIVKGKDRGLLGRPAPAKGLYLQKVYY